MTSVSNKSDQENPDYFSRLPPELLDDIFDEAYDAETPLTGPICRSLYPYFVSRRYRRIELSSYQQLSKFCARISPGIASHIETFVIDIPFVKNEEDEDEFEGYDEESRAEAEEAKPVKETIDTGWPKDEQLSVMFRKLEEVKEVEVKGSTRIALLVLSPQIANSSLPHLRSIILDSSFDCIEDPFHTSHYSSLVFYEELAKFDLSIQRPSDSIVPSSKPLPPCNITHDRFGYLRIKGPLGASPFASSLVSTQPGLVSLRLHDTAAGTTPSPILAVLNTVRYPEELLVLTLDCTRRQVRIAGDLSNSLSRLSSLEVFAISGPWPALPNSVYKTFGTLPLRELLCGPRTPVSLARLKDLVCGPSKSPTLRLLNLSTVESKSIRLAAAYEREMFGPNWEDVPPATSFAKWTRQFSKSALYDLMESTAEDKTLMIDGTAVEALIKEDIWMPAREKARWRYGRGGNGDQDSETDDEWETGSSESSEEVHDHDSDGND
ncbi:hypothetical protein JCM5353_004036 [Sporobolomyces roseus]